MAGTWRDYLNLLENLRRKLEDLTRLAQTKTVPAGRSDLDGLEACMKQEQVLSLALRGMDQKRDKMLAEMGITGVRLRELVEHAPEDMARETKEGAEKLRQQYELFRSASDVARNTLECNLHIIERLQKAQDVQPEENPRRQSDFRA